MCAVGIRASLSLAVVRASVGQTRSVQLNQAESTYVQYSTLLESVPLVEYIESTDSHA